MGQLNQDIEQGRACGVQTPDIIAFVGVWITEQKHATRLRAVADTVANGGSNSLYTAGIILPSPPPTGGVR